MYEDAFTPLEPLDALGPSSPLPIDLERTLAGLQSSDPGLRMQSARVFCDVEEPRAVEPLAGLLADPCPLVRVSAAYALGRNSAAQVVEPLIATLRQDWNGYVRKGVVWALGNSRDPRAIPALLEGMGQDITAVRLWSASALGQLASLATPETVIEIVHTLSQGMLQDPVAAVRSNAAWALGRMHQQIQTDLDLAEQVGQVLFKVMQVDPDLGVRDDARWALGKIATSETWGELEDLELI